MTEDLPFSIQVLKEAVGKEHQSDVGSVEISNLKTYAGSKKHDGFVCEVIAVDFDANVNNKTFQKHYMVKYLKKGPKSAMFKALLFSERECLNYTWLVPNLQQIRMNKNLQPLAFINCHLASLTEDLLIMDNLKMIGYKAVDKKPEPLQFITVQQVLKELASFHATGLHFMQNYPGGEAGLHKDYPMIFTKELSAGAPEGSGRQMISHIAKSGANTIKSFCDILRENGEEMLANNMEKFSPIVFDSVVRVFDGEWKICLLTHGDLWFSNILIKDPTNLKIIDLQGMQLGRLGVELAYFIMTSSSPAQRENRLNDLLRLYYDTLLEELQAVGCAIGVPFTFEQLVEEFFECLPHGFLFGCNHTMGLSLTDDVDIEFDIEDVIKEENASKVMEQMQGIVKKRAAEDPEFFKLIKGLAKEGKALNIY